jgi:hypothetical protein
VVWALRGLVRAMLAMITSVPNKERGIGLSNVTEPIDKRGLRRSVPGVNGEAADIVEKTCVRYRSSVAPNLPRT